MSRSFSRALTPLSRWGTWDIEPSRSNWAVDPFRTFFSPSQRLSQLNTLEDTFRDLERQFSRLESDMNSVLRQLVGVPSKWGQREVLGMEPEILGEGEIKRYRLNLHMGASFSPENVKVSLKDRLMTVEARQGQKSDDGNTRLYQEVSRVFTLPDEVDAKDVNSVLNSDDVLTIEAPVHYKALPEPPKPKEIPVIME